MNEIYLSKAHGGRRKGSCIRVLQRGEPLKDGSVDRARAEALVRARIARKTKPPAQDEEE